MRIRNEPTISDAIPTCNKAWQNIMSCARSCSKGNVEADRGLNNGKGEQQTWHCSGLVSIRNLVFYCTKLYYTRRNYIILYYTVLCYTVLWHIVVWAWVLVEVKHLGLGAWLGYGYFTTNISRQTTITLTTGRKSTIHDSQNTRNPSYLIRSTTCYNYPISSLE